VLLNPRSIKPFVETLVYTIEEMVEGEGGALVCAAALFPTALPF
jgi:hypothetical protein